MWQRAVMDSAPSLGRILAFEMRSGCDPRSALARVREAGSSYSCVLGVGLPLVAALGKSIPGLRPFPPLSGPGLAFPSTQGAFWALVGASSASEVHDGSTSIRVALGDGFRLQEEVATFRYRDGRDLSGYLDGTANPTEEKAVAAAILSGFGPGLDGSTFMAAQRYVHDLTRMRELPQSKRDRIIGRRLSDNEEIADAPASAHVKRSEQESFDPQAFMLRRSMPWGGVAEQGLYFIAYGESLDRFERVLRRMAGLDDGIVDGLLSFTRAVSGGYYWCPPVTQGKLDWSALGV